MSTFIEKIGHAILGFILALFFASSAQPTAPIVTPNVSTSTVAQSATSMTVTPATATTSAPTPTLVAAVSAEINNTAPTSSPKNPLPVKTPVSIPVTPPIQKTVPTAATSSISISSVDGGGALVNIFCLTSASSGIPSITGSGSIINTDGVIITSAHIAQYFLLEETLGEQSVNCIIRAGSPAAPALQARLLYISPTWIEDNSLSSISSADPRGTGEDDYALLLITNKITATSAVYGYIPPDPSLADLSAVGQTVSLFAYPTNPSGIIYSTDKLYPKTDISSIAQVSTFGNNTLDFLTIPSTLLAVKGSSGGEVVRNNELVGVIDTVETTPTGSPQELGAITISYINRSMLSDSGVDLLSFINGGDLSQKADQFQQYISPSLINSLIRSLENQQ